MDKNRRNLKIEYVKISELKEWNRNPRKNEHAAERLSQLIDKHGFINPVIATPDKVIRAGHTRIKAAKKLGIEKVPVVFVNFETEAEAMAYSISDNKSQTYSDWDYPLLLELLEELQSKSINVEITGFTDKEFEELITIGESNFENILEGIEENTFADTVKAESERESFAMTFIFPLEYEAYLDQYIKANTKDPIVAAVIELVSRWCEEQNNAE